MAVVADRFRQLEEADADASRLAVSERLGTDEQDAAQARPFIRSTSVCNFQLRD
jgi:hypothetical protein